MKPPERLNSDTEAVLAWLERFAGFPQYPPTGQALVARAETIARFVHNEPMEHPELGRVNDLDWVMGKILERAERCPLPAEVLSLHEQYFPSAEGETK